jgi:hypothetical protein
MINFLPDAPVFIQRDRESPRPAAAAEAAGAPTNIFPSADGADTKNAHTAPSWVGWEAARGAFSVGHL